MAPYLPCFVNATVAATNTVTESEFMRSNMFFIVMFPWYGIDIRQLYLKTNLYSELHI